MDTHSKQVKITVLKLLGLTVVMFVFAMWVMPPLYTLFCEFTGLNSKYTQGSYEAVSSEVDTSRTVRVKFVATNNENIPWDFIPAVYSIDVHPGQATDTSFFAHNLSTNYMVTQAIPSMIPSNARDYFHKTECFCFNSQLLAPGEQADLGLQFIVDQSIPKSVKSIILAYTLFDITAVSEAKIEKEIQARKNTPPSDEELFGTDNNSLTALLP
ncbi:MAG: cytochrome c oxidase assembly protein subunit 11 [Flavobacteriales bacterium]|jgi:cytochrome c oxidase assembly protein subunit 11